MTDEKERVSFDPKKHISYINENPDRPYMEVKWRIAWFRDAYPHGQVNTQLVSHGEGGAIIRAEVTAVGEGGEVLGTASGYGSCTAQEFAGGFIEKAETKAIGRALGVLGFGTQFADDFADAEDGIISDAPVEMNRRGGGGAQAERPSRGSQRGSGGYQGGNRGGGGGGRGGNRATNGQKDMIRIMGAERGIDSDRMSQLISRASDGKDTWDSMSFDTASAVITEMKTIPRLEGAPN